MRDRCQILPLWHAVLQNEVRQLDLRCETRGSLPPKGNCGQTRVLWKRGMGIGGRPWIQTRDCLLVVLWEHLLHRRDVPVCPYKETPVLHCQFDHTLCFDFIFDCSRFLLAVWLRWKGYAMYICTACSDSVFAPNCRNHPRYFPRCPANRELFTFYNGNGYIINYNNGGSVKCPS